jgi:hypothetical protein
MESAALTSRTPRASAHRWLLVAASETHIIRPTGHAMVTELDAKTGVVRWTLDLSANPS